MRYLLLLCVLLAGCATTGTPRNKHLVPASIPDEDLLCVERFPPEMQRWMCIELRELRSMLEHMLKANP